MRHCLFFSIIPQNCHLILQFNGISAVSNVPKLSAFTEKEKQNKRLSVSQHDSRSTWRMNKIALSSFSSIQRF